MRYALGLANGEESPLNQYKLVRDVTPGSAGWKFDLPAPPNPASEVTPFASSWSVPTASGCISAPYHPFHKGSSTTLGETCRGCRVAF